MTIDYFCGVTERIGVLSSVRPNQKWFKNGRPRTDALTHKRKDTIYDPREGD